MDSECSPFPESNAFTPGGWLFPELPGPCRCHFPSLGRVWMEVAVFSKVGLVRYENGVFCLLCVVEFGGVFSRTSQLLRRRQGCGQGHTHASRGSRSLPAALLPVT